MRLIKSKIIIANILFVSMLVNSSCATLPEHRGNLRNKDCAMLYDSLLTKKTVQPAGTGDFAYLAIGGVFVIGYSTLIFMVPSLLFYLVNEVLLRRDREKWYEMGCSPIDVDN